MLNVDGVEHEVSLDATLLEVLRGELGCTQVKDGCSPQGQCGCCTVLVDGVARVSCVTPVRRVVGRSITTAAGIDPVLSDRIVTAFEATGGSQCGFCTPGIVARLVGLARRGTPTETQVRTALGAHLCRCTGFQPIVEAALLALDPIQPLPERRNPAAAEARATLESGRPQVGGADVVLGAFRFAADSAPSGTKVAVAQSTGGYSVASTEAEAAAASGKVQGRNSTIAVRPPLPIPMVEGAVISLATSFVEPAYVEPDASWCAEGGDPASPFANAGAFGAKRTSTVSADARRLADELGEPILAIWPREEVVARGAKRPPLSLAIRADGSGRLTVATTEGSEDLAPLLDAVAEIAPGLEASIVEVPGPKVGATHRGAVVAEVLAALAARGLAPGDPATVVAPNGARATVSIDSSNGTVKVDVDAGDPICAITLRSYVIGAVHQGLGMVRSEGIAVDEMGVVHDLTIRSFGILTATQTPSVVVEVIDASGPAVACGVAVMAATMAAAWATAGHPPTWPTA